MGKASCAPKCLVLTNLLLGFLVFMPSVTHSASQALKKVNITCRYSFCEHSFNCSWKLQEKINGIDVKVRVQERNDKEYLKWKPCNGCNVSTQENHVLAEQGFIHIQPRNTYANGMDYRVSVTVQDDDGNETTSIITSLEDALQPNSPINVTISPVMDNDTYLNVRWDDSDTTYCLILKYKLRYRQDHQNEWDENEIEDSSSFVIVDAHPGRKHLVQVAAKDHFHGSWSEWSSVAYGWPWSPVEVTSTEALPRCQIHVTASPLVGKKNGLKVQWDVPQTCPHPLIYRLRCRQDEHIEWIEYKTKYTFFNIMDVRPGLKYIVQVAAVGIDHKILNNWTSVTYKHSCADNSTTADGGTTPWLAILIAIIVTLVSILALLALLAVWHKRLRHEYSPPTRKCSA